MLEHHLVVGAVDVEGGFVVEVGRPKRVQPVVLDEEVKNELERKESPFAELPYVTHADFTGHTAAF